jgi:hypothetical protein
MTVSKTREALNAANELARGCQGASDLELERMAESPNALQRLAALRVMQSRAQLSDSIERYFEVARRLIRDADNNCRWQALILVGAGVEREPDLVWEVVATEGGSRDSDMRAGVATVLLEHLLDAHFDVYFPKVRERVLSGDERFADMANLCWLSDDMQEKRLRSLVRNARRGRSESESS